MLDIIDLQEIDLAISRLEKEESSYSNYAKLADLYIVRDHNTNTEQNTSPSPATSQRRYPSDTSPLEESNEIIDLDSESEFLQALSGKSVSSVMPIIDDLMNSLKVISPRIYGSVMRKILQL